jgi:hypothetical protein
MAMAMAKVDDFAVVQRIEFFREGWFNRVFKDALTKVYLVRFWYQ